MATKAHLEGNKRYLEKLDHITIRVRHHSNLKKEVARLMMARRARAETPRQGRHGSPSAPGNTAALF